VAGWRVLLKESAVDDLRALGTKPGRTVLKKDDDLIDRLVEHHPGFRRLLQRRLRERSVPAAVASRRLAPRRPSRPRSRS